MAIIEIARIQVRRGRELGGGPGSPGAVPRLEPGEFGWAEDTENLYIGKRVVEGASNDNNTRILTDKDLTNLFTVYYTGSSAASTGTYRYRDNILWPNIRSTTTTVARKLDNFVSLTDFTNTNLVSGDITEVLSRAISNLYANGNLGKDAVRTLKIPAGDFQVSGTIDIPPYASIVGDGPGITTILHNVYNGGSLFRTVDNLGVNYDSGIGMQQNAGRSKNIHLSNLTVAYNTGSYNNKPLLSLDDTQDAVIDRVEFTSVSSSTGLGIAVRGSIGTNPDDYFARNVHINDCVFNNLDRGVEVFYKVGKTTISNSSFTNLNKGVKVFNTETNYYMPVDTQIFSNRFVDISNSAVETSTATAFRTNLISNNNVYHNVANLGSTDYSTTGTCPPVLNFLSLGNASVNDVFSRRDRAESTSTLYYNPLINANGKISNQVTYNQSVNNAGVNTVLKVPLTGREQVGYIDYSLSNNQMSRKGRLTLNISADGYASVSDYYNYSELVTDASQALVFSTDLTKGDTNDMANYKNYISVTCWNFSGLATSLEFTVELMVN